MNKLYQYIIYAGTILLLLHSSQPQATLADDRSPQPGAASNPHPIYEKGLWGYVDNDGRIVIKPQFLHGRDFFEGRAAVLTQDGAGYIRPDGSLSVVLPKDSSPVGRFSEGLAWFAKENRFGCIDLEGKVVIPPSYDWYEDFSEGMAVVAKVRKGAIPDPFDPDLGPKEFGFVDRNGRVSVPLRYEFASSFHDGLAFTNEGYIDRTGKVSISLKDLSSDPDRYIFTGVDFSNARALVVFVSKSRLPGKAVLIDTKGGRVAAFSCEGGSAFSEGLVGVFVNNKVGYIDISGRFAIPAKFDQGATFHEGLCLVRAGDELQYIDRGGAIIARGGQKGLEVWNDAEDFHNGLARVHIGGTLVTPNHGPVWWKGGKWCYIDRTGTIRCICRIDGDKPIEPQFGKRL